MYRVTTKNLFLALMLPLAAAACSPARATTCEAAIPMTMGGARPTIELSIDGGATLPVLFDTGATNTVLNVDHAEALGLVNEGPLGPPFDRGHSTQGYQTTLRGARLGGLALPATSMPVLSLPLPDFAAVFSPNTFRGRLVNLDFATGELRICDKTAENRPSGPSYGYSEPPFALPTIPVTIGSETIHAHMDTGSQRAFLFPTSYASRFKLAAPMQQVGSAGNHAGTRSPLYAARIIGTLQVGPLTVVDPEVHFTDIVPGPNVGLELLRQMRLTLDPEAQRVWATRRETPEAPTISH